LIKLGKGLAKLGGKLKGIARRIAGKKKRGKKAKARGAKPQKAVAKSKLAPKKDQKPKRKDADKKKQDKEQKKQERMERAKRELPTKINPLLTNGVSTLALRLRLGIWRIRYRLSSLQLSSGGIYAKASPGPELITGAERIRRQRIGLALEPHLKEAEAEFFRQRRAEMSDKESRIIKEKERAIVGDTRDVLELATPEQIELFRRIRAGDIKLPAPKSGKRPGSVRHPLIRPGEPGFSVFINDPARLARAYVIGAGAYPIPHKRLGRPSVRGLVHALEPARSEGLFAAGQVAHGLEKLGLATPHETHTGSLAPMAVEASAIAAERDIGISPATSKFDHSEEEAARLTRHERIGNIFARLNRLIDDPPVDIVSKSGSAKALTNLASAFQEWLKVHFPYNNAKSSEKEIKRAVNELMAQLVIFLQTVSSRRDE
jgi:hypothetical protein